MLCLLAFVCILVFHVRSRVLCCKSQPYANLQIYEEKGIMMWPAFCTIIDIFHNLTHWIHYCLHIIIAFITHKLPDTNHSTHDDWGSVTSTTSPWSMVNVMHLEMSAPSLPDMSISPCVCVPGTVNWWSLSDPQLYQCAVLDEPWVIINVWRAVLPWCGCGQCRVPCHWWSSRIFKSCGKYWPSSTCSGLLEYCGSQSAVGNHKWVVKVY